MKILFMNPEATLGGAERSLLDVMGSFREQHPEISLGLLLGADGSLHREAEQLGVTVYRVTVPEQLAAIGEAGLRMEWSRRSVGVALSGSTALAAHVAHVNRAIREFGPTVLHTNGVKSHVVAALAAPPRIPLVWHVRDFLSGRRVGSKLLKALSWRPKLAIANSQAVARDAEKILGRLRTRVVLNAIDTSVFRPDGPRADLDALASVEPAPTGALRVGLVATFAKWKGQDIFIEAARELAALRPDTAVRFYVIGGQAYRTQSSQFSEEELRKLAERCRVTKQVGFVPFQNPTAAALRALDIVVHASTQPEPFGRTIAEAMASERPIIAADGGGAREVADESCAVFVEPGSPQALAHAVHALAKRPDWRADLGKNGRRRALASLSRERLANDVLAAYSFGSIDSR